jgi:diguanylate cyclase (GGDEF)-like protein
MSRTWTVLYVAADAARSALGGELARRGYDVKCAPDREGALAVFRHQALDALLVDVASSEEGIELALEIKRLARDAFLPAILLSRPADSAVRVRAMRAGIDDACSKPVNVDELEARLTALLRVREREQRLRSETSRFRHIAFTDPLTGLGNRRAFDVELERAWARSARSGRPLALYLVDIDHFKRFNDRYGHRTGDEVLRAVGQALARDVRAGDQAFRFGGEEFAVLAPDADPERVRSLGERLREAVASQRVLPPPESSWHGPLSVTASVGVAVAPSALIATRTALVEAADHALYRAKDGGRDRVVELQPRRRIAPVEERLVAGRTETSRTAS